MIAGATGIKVHITERLGMGRLKAAAWVDSSRLLVGTAACLWRWSFSDGALEPFVDRGCGLLAVNSRKGLGAMTVETPSREVLVFSLEDGHLVQALPGHGGHLLLSLDISPDGRLIATGGSDRLLRIREIASGRELMTIEHPEGDSSMEGNPDLTVFSPDGTQIATAEKGGRICRLILWDVHTGEKLMQTDLPMAGGDLAFSPDGKILAVGMHSKGGFQSRDDRFLILVDPGTGAVQHALDTPTPEDARGHDLNAVAFSPDGRLLVVGEEADHLADTALHVFDTQSNQRTTCVTLREHFPEETRRINISGLSFSEDGSYLVSVVSSDINLGKGENLYAVVVWDTETWTPVGQLTDFMGVVNDLSLLPDDGILAAADAGLQRFAGKAQPATLVSRPVQTVAASPDGAYAVLGFPRFDGEARLLEVATENLGEPLPGITKDRVTSTAFASDNRHYAVCHSDYWIRRIGRKTAVKRPPRDQVKQRMDVFAAASPDGKMAFASWQGTLTIWWGEQFSQTTGPLRHPGLPRRLTAAAFSPDGAQVAAASGFYQRGIRSEDRYGRIFIWSLSDLAVRELVTLEENRWFECIAWSSDGQIIAAGTRHGVVCFFDAAEGDCLLEKSVHGDVVTALAFTADGRQLISASEDGGLLRMDLVLQEAINKG